MPDPRMECADAASLGTKLSCLINLREERYRISTYVGGGHDCAIQVVVRETDSEKYVKYPGLKCQMVLNV